MGADHVTTQARKDANSKKRGTNPDPLIGTVVHCVVCSHDEELRWNEVVNLRLAMYQLCFKCDFWHKYLDRAASGDLTCVRIDRVHYVVCAEKAGGVRGFGGTRRIIHIPSTAPHIKERFWITTNLWCQGDIPQRFWNLLPDNAKFVPSNTDEADLTRKGWVKLGR